MAQIQKGTTYSTGDQVTATNLNALADAAILLPGAITDQTAKTVPLAADTVLIHSAADTALRKSTLTQLFSNATGIPLTTGVTGILPAANGGTGVANASTLTIAGNVTHAGAFTQSFTATANTSLTLPVTGTLATLAGSEALSNKTITASPISGSTGAFTTLSASGQFTGQTSFSIASSGVDYPSSGYNFTRTATSGLYNYTTTDFSSRLEHTSGGFKFFTAPSGAAGNAITFTERANITSTGLAVTGALSASGLISRSDTTTGTAFYAGMAVSANAYRDIRLASAQSGSSYGAAVRGGLNGSGSPYGALMHYTASTETQVVTWNDAGLAVTGALSSTTGANFATSSGVVIVGPTTALVDTRLTAFATGDYSPAIGVKSTATAGSWARLDLVNTNTVGPAIMAQTSSGELFFRCEGTLSDINFQSAGGVERMRIVGASGNVGIGTSTPDLPLCIEKSSGQATIRLNRTGTFTGSDTTGQIIFGFAGDSLANIENVRDGANDAGALKFGTQATGGSVTERLRITSSGNVGIGTSSPQVSFQVNGIIRAATANDAGVLSLGESTGGTAVNVGIWRGLSNSLSGGNVLNLGGYAGIQFSTGAAVIGSQTSRMFLSDTGLAVTGALSATTAGRFGTTSAIIHGTESLSALASSGVTVGFACDAAASWPLSLWHKGTGTKDLAVFYSNDGGSFGLRGKIQTDGTGVSLISSSDERLKTNFRPITNSGVIIDALAPSLFDWLSGQKDTYGFGAQSTYQVFPQAVAKGDDNLTEITDQWGMDVSKLVPILVAELKALRQRVAALESN